MQNLTGFLPLILLGTLFYFLIIRPQVEQQKKRKELLASVKAGDKIRTISGVYGLIEKIDEDDLTVLIADNVRIRMARFGIEQIL